MIIKFKMNKVWSVCAKRNSLWSNSQTKTSHKTRQSVANSLIQFPTFQPKKLIIENFDMKMD